MRKKKKSLFFIITLLILSFGIGYAYLTTNLSINGTTDIDSNNWDVYFDNVNVTEGSVSGEQVIEAPTITSDTTVEFHINLKEPGEFYEFTIDAKNDGTIDAMIESVSKKVNGGTTIPAYLNYSVTYADDLKILDNHLLAHESLETYKIRVEYRTDIDPDDLPSSAQSLTLSFNVEYVQADENATEVLNTIYSDRCFSIGASILNNENLYKTDDEFSPRNNMYFKYDLKNRVVKNAYIGMKKDGVIYYLQGGGATYNESTESYNDDSIYYDDNKSMLRLAFGEENCYENLSYNTYNCTQPFLSGFASIDGQVEFSNYSGRWYIESSGIASITLDD